MNNPGTVFFMSRENANDFKIYLAHLRLHLSFPLVYLSNVF